MYPLAVKKLQRLLQFDLNYYFKGGFWMTAAQVVAIFFGLISTSLFAHYLSEHDFGVYKYILSLAAVISTFSLTGLGQSILQATAKGFSNFYLETTKINFRCSLCISLTSIAGATYYILNNNYVLGTGCLIIAVFQPIINTFQFLPAYLLGKLDHQSSAAIQASRIAFVSVFSICTLYFTSNVLILIFVYFASQALINIATHLVFKPEEATGTPVLEKNKFLRFAKHTSLQNIISLVAHRADNIYIFTQLGAVELAVYSIAIIIPEQIKGSFKNIASLLLPKYAGDSDTSSRIKFVPFRSLQLFFLLLTVTIFYIVAAPYIYKLIFPKYDTAVLLSQLFALSFLTYIYYIPLSMIQSKIDNRKLFTFHVGTSIIQLVVTPFFILWLGLIGAVISKLFIQTIRMFTAYYLLYKK